MKMLDSCLFRASYSFCMVCHSNGVRDAPKERLSTKTTRVLQKYNLTFSMYRRMYDAQKGKCAICGLSRDMKWDKLPFVVDHCHRTGVVRGLLCSQCNMGFAHGVKVVLCSQSSWLVAGVGRRGVVTVDTPTRDAQDLVALLSVLVGDDVWAEGDPCSLRVVRVVDDAINHRG